MRLFSGKVGLLASDVVRALTAENDIEVTSPREVELDVTSVLNTYVKLEQEASDAAREHVQRNGLPPSELARYKKLAAEQKGIKIGEDMLDYLLDQVVEILLHSANVEEVFSPDHELKRKMRPAFKKHLAVDEDLEKQVRGQLKHVKEGTATWEIEYQRVMADIRRRKGLG